MEILLSCWCLFFVGVGMWRFYIILHGVLVIKGKQMQQGKQNMI